MSKTRQFDRSKCFTFFNTYRTQGKRIREKYGDKMAADYYEAIIDYGLDQKPITDDELKLKCVCTEGCNKKLQDREQYSQE